jgi:hypothetical protein
MKSAVACTMLCLASVGLAASGGPEIDIASRAKGAGSVVVATVVQVSASFERNSYGDRLIVSHVLLQVEETMKGKPAALVPMDLEGGSVGDITLKVSDLPALTTGERGVFFLDATASGPQQPHLRGLGILKLDARNTVHGSSLTVSAIRDAVRTAR